MRNDELPGGPVGVPLMVLPASIRPAGRLPWMMEKLYVPVPNPPVALNVNGVYGTSCAPLDGQLLVICSGGATTLIAQLISAESAPLVARSTKDVVPGGPVEVPLIVFPLRLNPAGRLPLTTDQKYDPLPPVA